MTATGDDDMTTRVDDISGCTLEGAVLRDADVLALLRAEGLLRIVRGPAHRLRRSGWADQFSEYARDNGLYVRISEVGCFALIVDIDRPNKAPAPVADQRDSSLSRATHPSVGRWPHIVPDPPD